MTRRPHARCTPLTQRLHEVLSRHTHHTRTAPAVYVQYACLPGTVSATVATLHSTVTRTTATLLDCSVAPLERQRTLCCRTALETWSAAIINSSSEKRDIACVRASERACVQKVSNLNIILQHAISRGCCSYTHIDCYLTVHYLWACYGTFQSDAVPEAVWPLGVVGY